VVSLVDGKQWMMGRPQYSVIFDGREYRFPGDAEKSKFLANPDRYVPALNGNSVIAYATSGTLVPGNPRFGAYHLGRVYLFQDEREKAAFLDNPSDYAGADLAYRGASAVSLVDYRKNVAGNPGIATRYQGFRYLFASEQEREKFLRDPSRYAHQARP
jgi:YHS domain-containing protein